MEGKSKLEFVPPEVSEVQVETMNNVREFPFEVFSCIGHSDKNRLQSFFERECIFIQYYKDGEWYEYGVGEKMKCRLVIEDVEEFHIVFNELVYKIYQLPEEKEEWFKLEPENFELSIFVTVFSSATVKDFLNPVEFLKKWEFLLSDSTFENMREFYTPAPGVSIGVSERISQKRMESPQEFWFQLQDSDIATDLPLVRVGKTGEREVTIFSIQDQSIDGVNEGEAKKIYNGDLSEKFQNVCRKVESEREKYSEEEFKKKFLDYDSFDSKYEWYLKFFEYLRQSQDEKNPLFEQMLMNSKVCMFVRAKMVETSFQERRERRKNINKYLKGFSRGTGLISPAHILSFMTTILMCASHGVELVILPTDYPLRRHSNEKNDEEDDEFDEKSKGEIDSRIFDQKNALVRSVCRNLSGIFLQAEPDTEPFFSIKIKKEELACEKYPFIQSLIDEIVKK